MTINPILILGIGGVFALGLLVVGIVVSARSERTLVEERLGKYVDKKELEARKRQAATPLTDWVNRRVERSTLGDRISKDLARADLRMKPGEYIILIFICMVGGAFLGYFLGGKSILVGIIGMVVAAFLPRMYVRRQQKRRLIKFDEQLPDMLNLMVNGLRAGYSTLQAMEAVSKELPAPICDEFRRVVQEIQLGVGMEQAMDNLLRRIPSGDLDLVLTAINVQREVGGNLAEILDTISFTIRERIRIKGEIRVLTTQIAYSGRFLSILPVLVMAVLYLVNRTYVLEFTKPENIPCNFIAAGLSVFLIVIGSVIMNKLGQIEI